MKIFREIPDNKNLFSKPVLTVGNFDGVHIGHHKILKTLIRRAEESGGDPVAVTFAKHPRKILNPGIHIETLTSTEEKINLIYEAGIPNIIVLEFTAEMAGMSAGVFFNEIMIMKLDIRELVVGYDHAFGRNREGNFDYLKSVASDAGVTLTKVGEEIFDGKPVSSTRIKDAIREGRVDEVVPLLGRPYSLTGRVIPGAGRGRTLGFPTANIRPESGESLIPHRGVYAVSARVGSEKIRGVMNIGHNPTFGEAGLTLEAHLLDFDRDIYNETVSIEFLCRLRDEKKFAGPDELIRQISTDCRDAGEWFGNIR